MDIYIAIVSTIQAILEGISVWQSERDLGRTNESFDQAFSRVREDPHTKDIAARLSAVLPQDVAQTFRENVQQCWDNFKQCIYGKASEDDFIACEKSFRECVCANLRSMVRTNGSLPYDLLNIWKQCACGVIPPTS